MPKNIDHAIALAETQIADRNTVIAVVRLFSNTGTTTHGTLPLFLLTRFHALSRFSRSHTSSISCSVKAEFTVADFAMNGSVSPSPRAGASPRSFGSKASICWLFCRFLFTRYQSYLLSQSFGPSAIVSGSAYLFLHLSALECLNSFADSLT